MERYLLENWKIPECPVIDEEFTNADFKRFFDGIWRINSSILATVDDAALYSSPEPLRNPLIFYLGHPAAFMDKILMRVGLMKGNLNSDFIRLFHRGVDPANAQELNHIEGWGNSDELWRKRAETYQRVMEILGKIDCKHILDPSSQEYAVMMGIEHVSLHIFNELSNVRKVDLSLVSRPEYWDSAPVLETFLKNEAVFIEGGEVVLGKDEAVKTFGWDNEYGRRSINLRPFLVNKFLATNGDFLQFVEDRGYGDLRFWQGKGLEWFLRAGVKGPRFWRKDGGAYRLRLPFEEIDLPLNFPVEVNAFEAEAFIRWRNSNAFGAKARLMSEAEFARANEVEGGGDPGLSGRFGVNLKYGSPHAVGSLPGAKSIHGVYDLTGNVSEWLSDSFYPFEGFEPHHLYPDFSVPYFDSDHRMLAGGGFSNVGSSASKNYRLWFRNEFRFDSGFRLAFDV